MLYLYHTSTREMASWSHALNFEKEKTLKRCFETNTHAYLALL